jgi:hypothetical protein
LSQNLNAIRFFESHSDRSLFQLIEHSSFIWMSSDSGIPTLPGPPIRRSSSNRRRFSPEEDARFLGLIGNCPSPVWDQIAQEMPDRTARQCRERWHNYVKPDIRTEPWTKEEDNCLIAKVNELRYRWAAMTPFFNRRSESDVKNRWYYHLKKKCILDELSGKWTKLNLPGLLQNKSRGNRKHTHLHPSQAAQQLLKKTQNSIPSSKGPKSPEDPLESFEFCDLTCSDIEFGDSEIDS